MEDFPKYQTVSISHQKESAPLKHPNVPLYMLVLSHLLRIPFDVEVIGQILSIKMGEVMFEHIYMTIVAFCAIIMAIFTILQYKLNLKAASRAARHEKPSDI